MTTIAKEMTESEMTWAIDRGKRKNKFMEDFASYAKGKTYFVTEEDWVDQGRYGFKGVQNGPKQILNARGQLDTAEVTTVSLHGVKGWFIKKL